MYRPAPGPPRTDHREFSQFSGYSKFSLRGIVMPKFIPWQDGTWAHPPVQYREEGRSEGRVRVKSGGRREEEGGQGLFLVWG